MSTQGALKCQDSVELGTALHASHGCLENDRNEVTQHVCVPWVWINSGL